MKPYIPLILFALSACGFAYACRALANDAKEGVYVTMGGDMLYSHIWVASSFLGAAGVAMLPDLAWWWGLVALAAVIVPMWPVARIITALYQGNNAYIVASQAGSNAPGNWYSKPIFSLLGSRDRYSIEIIPHMNNTDHMVFADGYIGTTHGGITFTNWPDDYIHSSDDDMWQMDRTTFKRNAVAVTALAWYMSNVGAKDADTLLRVVVPNAAQRCYHLRQHRDSAGRLPCTTRCVERRQSRS